MRYNFPAMKPTVILGTKRTPIGDLRGELSSLLAPALGAVAVRAALEDAGVPPDAVGETLMGCVLPAGQGQAPARQAARAAGIPDSVPAATLNKMCGSGMFAAMLADDRIRAGRADFIVAGGMESMSNAPHLVDIRGGVRMGDAPLRDHMFADGLLDAYEGELMGVFAQRTADQSGFSREEMDDFAVESIRRAQKSQAEDTDQNEIVPVVVPARKGDVTVRQDELPRKARPENIPKLRPRLLQGWNGDRGKFQRHFGRGGGADFGERGGGGKAGVAPAGADCGAVHPRARAVGIHSGAIGRDSKGAGFCRMEGGRRRLV